MARGRPREFDMDEALDRLMKVFWRKGYDGASMTDLTEALGISRPSLYAAFGAKDELFRKVLERYANGPASFLNEAMSAPTARAVVEAMLHGAADLHGDGRNPPGCLVVHGALVGSDESKAARDETRRRREALRLAILERLVQARSEGEFAAGEDCVALARYVVAVMRGMAVEAASGATGEELHKIVDIAMRSWPEENRPAAQIPVRGRGAKAASPRILTRRI
jgi:AcrR family transcriptional regulator